MIDQKTLLQGLALLRPLGLEQQDDEAVKICLSFLNDVSPFNGEDLPEDQRLNITQEEFEEACKHLARRHTSFYPGSNILAILIKRVKEYRKEQDDKKGVPIKIKSKATFYAGTNFRSLLEAHWALFFDSIGWSYRYEPNQFDLGKYKYKPDFLLTRFNIFIEIKPHKMTDDELTLAVEKCHLLQLHTKKRVWLIRGNPAPFDFSIFNARGNYSTHLGLSECLECEAINLGYAWYQKEGVNWLSEVPIKNKTQICQVEKIGGKDGCNCANSTQYEIKDVVAEPESYPMEEDVDLEFEECLEEPLPIDDPESPDFIAYRHKDLKLEEIEAGPPTKLKRAFLEVHRLKDDRHVFQQMFSGQGYGEKDFISESKQVLKEFSKNILKSFPK